MISEKNKEILLMGRLVGKPGCEKCNGLGYTWNNKVCKKCKKHILKHFGQKELDRLEELCFRREEFEEAEADHSSRY